MPADQMVSTAKLYRMTPRPRHTLTAFEDDRTTADALRINGCKFTDIEGKRGDAVPCWFEDSRLQHACLAVCGEDLDADWVMACVGLPT